jgi:hypothetical protein
VAQPLKLKEGAYTWQVTPWNPVGYGTIAQGEFDVHFANGYDNSFDTYMDGVTPLYPKSSWWGLIMSNLVTLYGNNNTWASARLDATYDDVDMTAIMYRAGDPIYSNGVILRGNPTLVSGKDWKNGYEFLFVHEGYFSVWKKYNGRAYEMVPWTYSSAIVGGPNTIRVVASGSTLSYSINGTQVWTGTDEAYGPDLTSGSAGVLSYIANWWDYLDLLVIDRITTGPVAGVSTEDQVSAEQQELNEAAKANPTGSPAGPNISMEQYDLLQSMPAAPEISFQEKLQLCQASGLPKCDLIPLP